MRLDEFLRSEVTEIEHCSSRHLCPFGSICAARTRDNHPPLFPTILEVDKGEMLWTDMRFEQRVFVIRSGVFVGVAHGDGDTEVPYALYGSGIAIGTAELYAPRTMSNMYYLRALQSGKVCSLPMSALRRHLEMLVSPMAQRIVSCVLTNLAVAAYMQTKVMARSSLRERVLMQLLVVYDITLRSGKDVRMFKMTHEELAILVGSDRVSVMRTLHRLRDEGLIELGYTAIALTDQLLQERALVVEAHGDFFVAEETERH